MLKIFSTHRIVPLTGTAMLECRSSYPVGFFIGLFHVSAISKSVRINETLAYLSYVGKKCVQCLTVTTYDQKELVFDCQINPLDSGGKIKVGCEKRAD